MEKEEFSALFTNWKEQLIINCEAFAKNSEYNLDLDFYAFQSGVRPNPPVLIIGTNPGGDMTYNEMNKINQRQGRSLNDLGDGDVNMFIANPQWKISQGILSLFSTEKLQTILKQAVITNLVYFNTNNFSDFERRRGAKEAIAFCAISNRELIKILQPKNILLLGNHAPKFLSPYFDQPMEDILRTRNDRTALIRKTAIEGISTYWMCHPSSPRGFWSGENIIMKRDIIETLF